jgi:hypothetical protein
MMSEDDWDIVAHKPAYTLQQTRRGLNSAMTAYHYHIGFRTGRTGRTIELPASKAD